MAWDDFKNELSLGKDKPCQNNFLCYKTRQQIFFHGKVYENIRSLDLKLIVLFPMENQLLFITLPGIFALLSSLVALGAKHSPTLTRHLGAALLGLAGLSALLIGGIVLVEEILLSAQLPIGLPHLNWHLRLDGLSGFFFIVIGLVTFAISLYMPSYVREFEHSPYSLSVLGGFTGLFITGMFLVVAADDAFTFMVAWEVMSLSSYFLVVYQHLHPANRRAAFLYLLMAHIGGLAILLSFGILAGFSGYMTFEAFTFDAMRGAQLPLGWSSIAFGLGLLGFGMKAGLVPLHAWLPEAHPVAPSHISALMSGVMLKVAIYGLIRLVFDLLEAHLHWSWGLVLLLLGSATAFLGILYALVQNDLKRLLAYSSIENMGIICIGLGLSLLFIAHGHLNLGALGLTAALYHALNHALFKSLLFLGAGVILHSTHEQNLEHMGGLIHRIPYTTVFFLIGCLSISALPPFNGFVSEWLIFQTALQAPTLQSGVLRSIIPIGAALLALTAALSATCFVKAFGIAFLGQPRTRHIRHAREAEIGMRLALGFLATLCLLLGILPTTIVNIIEKITYHLIEHGLPAESMEGWIWLTPISAQVASYSAPLVLLFIIVVWGTVYLTLHGTRKTRRTFPWDCGFGPLTARMQYTSSAFSMPIRRIFQAAWHIEESVKETKDLTLYNKEVHYHIQISDHSWTALYEPVIHWVTHTARLVARIQTGQIRTYLAYSFFTLLLLLWLIT